MDEYTIERISREKLTDLISIFRASFGRDISLEELHRKYDTDFLGQSYIGFIAYAPVTREPAAYYGVFPMEVMIDDKKYLIAQSGDTMTHPRHQGKGLFIKLAKQTYELCKALDIKAVFGFPSESSYPGFVKKLNWQHPENIQTYSLWVYTVPLSAMLKVRLTRLLYSLWKNFVLSFYRKGNFFQTSVSKNQNDYIFRSEKFWDYKLRNDSNRCLKIGGADVVLKTGVSLGIGDIHVSSVHDYAKAVRGITRLAFLLGTPSVSFYVSPDVLLDTYLKGKYVAKPGLAVGYLNFDAPPDMARLKYTYFDFDTF